MANLYYVDDDRLAIDVQAQVRNRRAARLAYERKIDGLDLMATYCLPMAIRIFDDDFKQLPLNSAEYWIQLGENLERYLTKADLRMRVMENHLLDSDDDGEIPRNPSVRLDFPQMSARERRALNPDYNR